MRGARRIRRRTAARAALVALFALGLLIVLWSRGAPALSSGSPPASPVSSPAAVSEARAGNGPVERPRAEIAEAAASEQELSEAEPSWPTVRGRLVDPAGNGVGGMVVVYEGQPGTPPRKMWRRSLDTEDDGAFELDLHVASRYVLVGMCYGFAPSAALSFEVGAAQRLPDVTLAVQGLAEIRGVVVDDAGAPRSGGRMNAFLSLTTPGGTAIPWGTEGERSPVVELAHDGSFVIAGLLAERTYDLMYEPPDDRPARAYWKGIRASDSPLVLTAHDEDLRCGLVTGSVRDAAGATLTGYEITIGGGWAHVDDATGRFEMSVKWGTEAPVLVRLASRATVFQVGTCRIDQESQERTFQLPQPGALTVLVRDGAGTPVVGAVVTGELDVHAHVGAESWPSNALLEPRKTLPGGKASFAALGPGPYRLTATWDGMHAEAVADVQSGVESSVEIVLPAR